MKRVFGIGSEWLYFKIYSGYKTTDIILVEYLSEKIEELVCQNIIKKWFFIRYNDPYSHLRIRFQVNHLDDVFQVITALSSVFEDLFDKNFVWKVQTDTYLREVERYGLQTMEDSETLFYFDSKMMLEYLSLKNNFENDEVQLLFSFMAIDSFLDAFSLSLSEKMTLLDRIQQSFKKEFNADKTLKTQFDKHYRSLENDVINVFNREDNSNLHSLYEIIEEKSNNCKPIVKSILDKLEINQNDFLSSHIHMMLNRQFTSRQREYETLIYDHLHRYYKMCFYRKVDFYSTFTTANL